jgi:hypothetical protein
VELRVDGATLAWYPPDEVGDAVRHLTAMARRREGRVLTVVEVGPDRGEVVLRTLHTEPA